MKITVVEAADLLGMSVKSVRNLIEEESLPAQQIRGQYRINRTELLEWATEQRIDVSPEAFKVEKLTPSLRDALQAGGVHDAVPGRDVTTALRHIVEKLRLADERDRETLLDVLLARGSLGVTPVGEGIAIPHVRTPIILSTTEVVISLSFLATPIDLGAPDARAIDTFFFLISPTVHVHLAMLARLAHALRTDSFKRAVRGRVPAEIFEAARSVEGAS